MGKHQMSPRALLRLYRDGTIGGDEMTVIVAIQWSDLHAVQSVARKTGIPSGEVRAMIDWMKELGLVHESNFQLEVADQVDWIYIASRVRERSRNTSTPRSPPYRGGLSGCREKEKKQTPKETKPVHPRWINFATQLAMAISTGRKVNSKSKISGWAQSFKKLHDTDGIPTLRIRRVLKWYCHQVEKEGDLIQENSKYLPIALSGGAFREKFLRIEDAMKRQASKKDTSTREFDEPPPDSIGWKKMEPRKALQEESEDHAFWDSIANDLDEDEE